MKMTHIMTRRHDNRKYLCTDNLCTSIFFTGGCKRGLCRSKPCHGNAEGRTGDVIQTGLMAETDGIRIAAMLPANSEFELRPALSPAFDRDFHELTHAFAIDCHERIPLDQSARQIFA